MATISPRQFGMLVFLMRMGLTIVRLPALQVIEKGPDAWIAVLLGISVGSALLWLVLAQAAREPNRTLMQRLEGSFGPLGGRAVGLLYLLLFWWDTMLTIRMYAGLLVSQPMPETPAEAFILLLMAGAAYAAIKGPEVIARVGEFITPLVFLGVLIVLVAGVNHMNPRALQPVLGYGWEQVLRAALLPAAVHAELMAVLMLAPLVREPKRMVRAGVTGALAAGLLTAVAVVALIMFYGMPRTNRLVFPLYDMARAISFGDFFERIDALFIFTWTAGSFVKVALLLWATAYGLAHVLRVKECTALVRPLGLLTGLAALRVYANQAEVRMITSPQVYTLIAVPFLVLFPALLAVAERLRRPGRGAS